MAIGLMIRKPTYKYNYYYRYLLGVLVVASFTAEYMSLRSLPSAYYENGMRSVAVLPETYPIRSGKNDWKYKYMDSVPSPDQEWPVSAAILQKQRFNNTRHHTLTTCIPAMFRDIETNLPNLLGSIAAQSAPANEVIIVMSDVPTSQYVGSDVASSSTTVGTQICLKSYQHLLEALESNNADYNSPLRLVCVGERLTAGRARNVAGQLAGGNIVSFMDADDREYPERNQVVLNAFDCHQNLRLFLHSCQRIEEPHKHEQTEIALGDNKGSATCSFFEKDGLEVVRGVELYDALQETHSRWWIREDIAHGHLVVHRSVLQHVHFSSIYHGEDSLMVRDILYQYGRSDEAAIFVNQPLTSYVKAGNSNKDLVAA